MRYTCYNEIKRWAGSLELQFDKEVVPMKDEIVFWSGRAKTSELFCVRTQSVATQRKSIIKKPQ